MTAVRACLAFVGLATACVSDPVFVHGAGGAASTSSSTGGPSATTSAAATTVAATTTGAATTSTGTSMTCGNWVVDAGEACDDGNTADGDGCSAGCTLEATCGNGVVEPGELCDGAPGDCGAACLPTPSGACGVAAEYPLGTSTVMGGVANDAYEGSEACDMPIGHLGWVDSGPLPMRLVVRPQSFSDDLLLRGGCTGAVLGTCESAEITGLLPPHTIVWVGVVIPNASPTSTFAART